MPPEQREAERLRGRERYAKHGEELSPDRRATALEMNRQRRAVDRETRTNIVLRMNVLLLMWHLLMALTFQS